MVEDMTFQVQINLRLVPGEQVSSEAESVSEERIGILDHVSNLKSRIAKHITFDKDGIFADPNWPYLW